MKSAVATNIVMPARDNGSLQSFIPENSPSLRANLDIRVGSMNEWQLSSIKKVLGFKSLAQGWDSYGSPGLGKAATQAAISFLTSIPYSDLPTPRIVPVSGGGVQFEWTNGNRDLEIEVRPDGAIEILAVENGFPLEGEAEPLLSVATVYSMFYWLFSAK